MRFLFISLYLFTLLFHTNTFADTAIKASFDCDKAKTVVEKDICSNPKTAELDKKVSAAFFDLKNHPQGRIKISVEQLVKDQKEWLKNRGNDKCLGSCLQKKYEDRLELLSFPGAPEKLSDEKVKELEKYFTDKSCESLIPLTENNIIVTDGLNDFACKIYEINPTMGNSLFSNCYGSNMDNFTPRCDPAAALQKVDGLKEYTDLLSSLYGRDAPECGTMRYGEYKTQNSAILSALYDTNPTGKISESASLKHFSLTSLWSNEQYKKYLQLKERAQKGLEKYYIEVRKIPADQAKKAAEYHVLNLAATYIDSHTGSRDDWSLTDVNNFLKNGTLPENKDFNYETILGYPVGKDVTTEAAKPDILAYFLTLAIVNNYSKTDIEKIIVAGANLKNPSVSDNALMNSIKRPDIMKLLIEKGANVNAQNTFGKTALMYAIQYGNLDTVKILVDNKADVNLATFEKLEADCDHTLEAGNRTPLMYAAWHADNDVIKYLISKGAKTDAKDTNGHDYKFYLTKNDYKKN